MRAVVCGIAVAGLALACGKSRAPPAPDASVATAADVRPEDEPEATALCQELAPCAPGQAFMCSLGGRRNEPARYGAPGVRIERLACRYRKLGEDYVVGVPDDGGAKLTHLDLFLRVQGTPIERARAAAELVVDQPLEVDAAGCTPSLDGGDTLRFCTRRETSSQGSVSRCIADRSGAVACSATGPEGARMACRRSFGSDRVVAAEVFFAPDVHGPLAMSMSVIASDHVRGGTSTGAPLPSLRAAAMTVHVTSCSPSGAYPFRYAYWGEGDDGSHAFATDLFAHLETAAMRAAVAADLGLEDRDRRGFMLLDPVGGLDAMVVPEEGNRRCTLPPGPRQENGAISFYVWQGGSSGPALRHCRVNLRSGRGICGSVTPGTFC